MDHIVSESPSFELLQAKRRDVFRLVAAMPFERQVHRQDPTGWSPLEVLEHLNLHDAWVLASPTIRKGPGSASPFLQLGKWLPQTGISYPTAPFLEPKGGQTLPQLAAASDEMHTKLANLIANTSAGHTVIHMFPFGSLTPEQLSAALDAHYLYHLKRL